jgi:hypothetical protein
MSAKERIVGVAVSALFILVVLKWFVPGPPMILNPRADPGLVEKGVAMVMICGEANNSFEHAPGSPEPPHVELMVFFEAHRANRVTIPLTLSGATRSGRTRT